MTDQEKVSFYSKTVMAEPEASMKSPASPEKEPHKRTSFARIQSMRARQKPKLKPLPGDRFYKACLRLPLIVKAFLVTLLTGLPFSIFLALSYTTFYGRDIGDRNKLHVKYNELGLFLSIAWASLLVIFALAEAFGRFGTWVCGMSKASIRYAPLAQTLCFRITMMAWVGAMHLTTCLIWPESTDSSFNKTWEYQLREAFMFLIIAFTIIFIQGLCLQLIAIQYVAGYIGPRSVRASNELEIILELNNLIKPHIGAENPGIVTKMLRKVFMPVEDSIFNDIRSGRFDEDEVKCYAETIWTTITGNKAALTLNDITHRLREMGRDTDKGEELFILLDESCDSEVSRAELGNLVMKTAIQLKKRAGAMRGIQLLLGKLEFLLTIVMFGFIVFVYTNFFEQGWAKNVAALWTGLTGLGFAIGGAVTEFVNSCVYVFAKHAYDVGDFVAVKGLKLVVTEVHLTHTNFEEVNSPDERGKVVQISHAALSSETITNWTRSADVLQEEQEGEHAPAAGATP